MDHPPRTAEPPSVLALPTQPHPNPQPAVLAGPADLVPVGPALSLAGIDPQMVSDIHARLDAAFHQLRRRYTVDEVWRAVRKFRYVMQMNVREEIGEASRFERMGIDLRFPWKSALFMRMLDGLSPLLAPAPTSYSFPAYSVMDEPTGTQHRVRAWFDPSGTSMVSIDHCLYAITRRNGEALQAENMLRAGINAFNWNLFSALCASGPVWELRFGHWPHFHLSVGRVQEMYSPRERVEQRPSDKFEYEDVCVRGAWGWHVPSEASKPAGDEAQRAYTPFECDGWVLSRPPSDWGRRNIYLSLPSWLDHADAAAASPLATDGPAPPASSAQEIEGALESEALEA